MGGGTLSVWGFLPVGVEKMGVCRKEGGNGSAAALMQLFLLGGGSSHVSSDHLRSLSRAFHKTHRLPRAVLRVVEDILVQFDIIKRLKMYRADIQCRLFCRGTYESSLNDFTKAALRQPYSHMWEIGSDYLSFGFNNDTDPIRWCPLCCYNHTNV